MIIEGMRTKHFRTHCAFLAKIYANDLNNNISARAYDQQHHK